MDARDRQIERLTARIEALERVNAMLWDLLRMGPGEEAARWPPLSVAEEASFAPTQPPAVLQEAPEPLAARGGFNKFAPPGEKIALFRSLFQGREDVYARRWQSLKTGKSGYSPACANEWAPGVCPKPKGSCKDCEHRELLPLTDAVIETSCVWRAPRLLAA